MGDGLLALRRSKQETNSRILITNCERGQSDAWVGAGALGEAERAYKLGKPIFVASPHGGGTRVSK